MSAREPTRLPIAIVGAGFGGLCIAKKLLDAGYENFVVLEREAALGGTWRDNTYPGAECDIPSALYSYSFALNPAWPNKWSHQPVILDYLRDCAERFGIAERIRYGVEVLCARFDEGGAEWRLDVTTPAGPAELRV
ncbi:MAG: NAD(P)/FAD-dependent oxidoreductase, partial [Pseudomonadota bacterium]